MADLGSFPVTSSASGSKRIARKAAGYWGATRGALMDRLLISLPFRDVALHGVPTAGVLSGSVLEAGAPVPDCVVRCYERISGNRVSEVRTDENGLFSIDGLRLSSIDYYVIALDPDGGALYNALIFDRVAPM